VPGVEDDTEPARRRDRRADVAGLVTGALLVAATSLFGLTHVRFPGSLVLAAVAAVVTAAVMWWVRRPRR
jgi:uncharacterized BrkB/YihY/UPF0761 family membrane protein